MKIITPKTFLKVFNSYRLSAGFTLVETMLAASLSLVVVGGAGFGLVNLLSNDRTANASSDIEYDLNRAVEFISDEIRMASRIGTDASVVSNFNSTGKNVILVLEMPQLDENGRPIKVVYYTQAKANETTATQTQWQGPQIISRWGPNFDENGQYKKNAAGKIPAPTTGSTIVWQYEPLIDLIADNIPNKNCQNTGTDWTRNPIKNEDVKGFFVCIRNDGKLAELHANASVTLNNGETTAYEVATEVFARAESPVPPIVPPPPPAVPSIKFCVDSVVCIPPDTSITFEVLGGEITCGKKGKSVPVTTNLYLDYPDGKRGSAQLLAKKPLRLPTQPSGTKVKIESIAQSATCNGGYYNEVDSSDNSVRIKVLKNGDAVPNITPFSKQATIKSFLKPYIENGKIKIGNHQVIYLFEHGSGDTTNADYDLQDNVVLATLEPSRSQGDSLTITNVPSNNRGEGGL